MARFWLDRIGLTERADDPAGALPYGEQRRLEIARAMWADPSFSVSTSLPPASIRENGAS